MIELLEHNKPTYAELCEKLESNNRVALIQATGTGKSYIIGKYLEEHKGKSLILVPTNAIGDQWEKLLRKTGCDFTIDTYQGMSAHIDDETNYDIVVADEMHHLGSKVWGKSFVDRFLKNESQIIIGVTATEIRYLDNSRDMAYELFGNNTVRGCNLEESIINGILSPFKYISVWYESDKEIKKYLEKTKQIKSGKKDILANEILECKKNIASIKTAFRENLGDNKKIIVFLNSIKSIERHKTEITKAIGAKKNYSISSLDTDKKIAAEIENFEKQVELSVLFCVDILNEGVHLDRVDTVVFLRTTKSPQIYFQQLGRALSADNKNPMVFDFVCNSRSLRKISRDSFINNDRDIERINRNLPKEKQIIVSSYTKELTDLFDEIDDLLRRRKYTEEEIEFVKRHPEMNAIEIAKKLDRNVSCIYQIAKIYNLELRKDKQRHDEETVNKIIENKEKKINEIAQIVGIPESTVSSIMRRKKFKKRRITNFWGDDEIKILKDISLSADEVANRIGRSHQAIQLKRNQLGIYEKERKKEINVCLFDKGWKLSEIEEKLGLTHQWVRKILIDNGRIKKQVKTGVGIGKKRIAQIENGVQLRVYDSAVEAANDNGFKSPGKLNQAARVGGKSYGFYWKYV